MLRRTGRLAVVGLALTFGAAPAVAGDGYTVTDLGTLEEKANSWVWQQSINEGGLVAAYANDIENPNAFYGDVPFLWHRGKVTVLPELEGSFTTIPYSLNDLGQVVGYSRPAGGGPRAVRWDWDYYPRPGGRQGDGSEARCHHRRVSWRIETLGELPGDGFSGAFAVNNHHQVAGYSGVVISFDPFVLEHHAVLWHKNQVFPLPPLPGGGMADFAMDVNERGQIVGFSGPQFGFEHPALWYGGSVRDLGLIGGNWAQAIAVNEKGQVVGYGETADGSTHAFTWKNGVISDLGVLDDDDTFSGAFDINRKGQIVGYSGADLTDVSTSRAVLWEKGAMIELQTRIPADSGWTLLAACGINERGQISGYGIHDGQFRAFLLTPVR